MYVRGEEGLVAAKWIKGTIAMEILKCPEENDGHRVGAGGFIGGEEMAYNVEVFVQNLQHWATKCVLFMQGATM